MLKRVQYLYCDDGIEGSQLIPQCYFFWIFFFWRVLVNVLTVKADLCDKQGLEEEWSFYKPGSATQQAQHLDFT